MRIRALALFPALLIALASLPADAAQAVRADVVLHVTRVQPSHRLVETLRVEVPYGQDAKSLGFLPRGPERVAVGPAAFDVDDQGAFVVADPVRGKVFRIRVDVGKPVLTVLAPLPLPFTDLAVDRDGAVHIADLQTRTIRVAGADQRARFPGQARSMRFVRDGHSLVLRSGEMHKAVRNGLLTSARQVGVEKCNAEAGLVTLGGKRIQVEIGGPLASIRLVGVDAQANTYLIVEQFRTRGRLEVDRRVVVLDAEGGVEGHTRCAARASRSPGTGLRARSGWRAVPHGARHPRGHLHAVGGAAMKPRLAWLSPAAIVVFHALSAQAIPRSEIVGRAPEFEEHTWTCTAENLTASCADSSWEPARSLGPQVSIPYCWAIGPAFSSSISKSPTVGALVPFPLASSWIVRPAWTARAMSASSGSTRTSLGRHDSRCLDRDSHHGDATRRRVQRRQPPRHHVPRNGRERRRDRDRVDQRLACLGVCRRSRAWSVFAGYLPRAYFYADLTEHPGQGTTSDPILIDAFPFVDSRNTSNATSDVFDYYSGGSRHRRDGTGVHLRLSCRLRWNAHRERQ